MSTRKIAIITVSGILGGVAILIGVILNFFHDASEFRKTLPERAEAFYLDNKEMLNEFVELSFENDISYMADSEYSGKDELIFKINGYYVYVDDELSDELSTETEKRLSEMIDVFKKSNIGNVYIDENNDSYVSFAMTKYSTGIQITYTNEGMSIEEIKKKEHADNAWYIEDNWVIVD